MDEEQDVVETGIREGELAATEAEAKVGATLSPFETFFTRYSQINRGGKVESADRTAPCGGSRESTGPPSRARSASTSPQARN